MELKSAENISVPVDKRIPTVMTERCDCIDREVLKQRTAVSASQVERSQAVPYERPANDDSYNPIPAPCTVTLTDPVAGAFARSITLSEPVSKDKA